MDRRRFQTLLPWAMAGAQLPARAQSTLRLAGAYPADSFHTINLVAFANEVKQATAGRIDIEVRGNGELLKAADILAGTVDGRADAGELIMSSLSKEHPVLGIDSFPFIVSSYSDARMLWAASRDAVAQALAKQRLQLLFAVPWQPQNLYSTRPISKAEDFVGLRMRYYNPATQRIAELLGAKPVTTALQMGAIEKAIAAGEFDLMITSSWTGVVTKAWSKMTHYYQINAWIPKNVVFIRKEGLDRHGAADRTAVLEAARRAEDRGWKTSEQLNAELEAQLARNKVVVSGMDPAVRRVLDRTGERLAREWMAQAQPSEIQVLSSYMVQRATRN